MPSHDLFFLTNNSHPGFLVWECCRPADWPPITGCWVASDAARVFWLVTCQHSLVIICICQLATRPLPGCRADRGEAFRHCHSRSWVLLFPFWDDMASLASGSYPARFTVSHHAYPLHHRQKIPGSTADHIDTENTKRTCTGRTDHYWKSTVTKMTPTATESCPQSAIIFKRHSTG